MTFYFTGTGNSLYVAKKLDEKIPRVRMVQICFRIDGRESSPLSAIKMRRQKRSTWHTRKGGI